MNPGLAYGLLRSRSARAAIMAAVTLALLAPVILAGAIAGILAEAEQEGCDSPGVLEAPAGGPVGGQERYAEPLRLVPGHSYQVGASEYGGPGDPSAGSYGSIPNPREAYLPAHPDTFAELSVLQRNPADSAGFTFADADALANLPYMSALRVTHAGRSLILYKRDIGYGQGPGQTIANGQPYRLDVWWSAARQLTITKSAVQIALAPPTGTAGTLGELPESAAAAGGGGEGGCPLQAGASIPLPLVPGTRTRILASGLAAAGSEAPGRVKAMVGAGNRLYGTAYLYGGGHGSSLDTLQGAYDCSSAVSYVLHQGGALGQSALDSSQLAAYGLPGPGRWVSIYANAAHAFMYVAGLRFDTVEDPAYDTGPNSGKPGPRWRVSDSVPGWASWSVRHPPGL